MRTKPNQSAKAPSARNSSGAKKYTPRGLRRVTRKKLSSPSKLIAYDFETTRIAKGTPRPLYLTAHGEAPEFSFDGPVESMEHLALLLSTRFLTDDLSGAKFVAWNANNFDSYFLIYGIL